MQRFKRGGAVECLSIAGFGNDLLQSESESELNLLYIMGFEREIWEGPETLISPILIARYIIRWSIVWANMRNH